MNKLVVIAIMIGLFGCKKEDAPQPVHNIQFKSNISEAKYYDLSINGEKSDISKVYDIQGGVNVILKLYVDGGYKTSINGQDSTWITGTIYVDGVAAKYSAGYHNLTITYQAQ